MSIAEERPRKWTRVPGDKYKELLYEVKYFDQGGAARITLNRPERMNALTNIGLGEMCEAFSQASHDRTLGVVVLTGAGDQAFSTGGDVSWESSGGLRRQFEHPMSVHRAMRLCRHPVIAAVKGWCIGGGNHWAYWCDFTLAADNAKFGQNGPRVGSPADGHIVSYLARVVGTKKAREMWMLCRRYTAQEALDMGLINKVVALNKLDDEVDKWCEEVLLGNPTCIRALKRSFDTEMDHLMYSGNFIIHEEAPDYLGSEEYMEGPKAFEEKRKPNWAKYRK